MPRHAAPADTCTPGAAAGPETRWAFPPPWAEPFPARPSARGCDWNAEALIGLARQSFERGHHKVATQRCCMIEARGAEVPADLRRRVAQVWLGLPHREQARIRAAALSWARLAGGPAG